MIQSIQPLKYDLFAGLDVDKHSIAITVRDHSDFVRSLKMPNEGQKLKSFFQNHFPEKQIACTYEAGPTGWGLYDFLTLSGIPCLVVSPSLIPKKPGAMVKTNRKDSDDLCLLLRGGQIKGVRIPSPVYRQLRHLVTLRHDYVSRAAGTKLKIKSLFLFENIPFPPAPAGSQWSARIIKQLYELPLDGAVRFKLHSLLDTHQFLRLKAVETQKEIRRFCKKDQDISDSLGFLTSIPGIGPVISVHFLARIGDWRNLKNASEVGAFLGLVPRENSTGDTIRKGSITHTGDESLRAKLIEGAWTAIKWDKELAEFYSRIKQRHPQDRGARKAIVAVARKLTARMYAVLTQRRMYVKP